MKTFQELKKAAKRVSDDLPVIKIAVLGDSATQLLCVALKGTFACHGFKLEIWEADFNQIELQMLNPDSEYHRFKADFTILFQSTHKLLDLYNTLDLNAKKHLAGQRIELIGNLSDMAEGKLLCFDYPEINDNVFGSFGLKIESSFIFQLRKLNFMLCEFAAAKPNVYLCDIADIQNQYGRNTTFDSNIYTGTEMVLSINVLPQIAKRVADIVLALKGKFKKCLILDLDNTLWGGVVGDDGWEGIQIGHNLGIGKAFSEFQAWIKQLKERGIILAVCSKNDENIAKEPFEKNPEMILHLDDFAMFVANWNNKADNIMHIREVLNIGADSMVFIDDNPVERDIVRRNIPDICVPEMPEDPADYLEFLYAQNLFEAASFSDEDSARTAQYQAEANRAVAHKKFADEDEFLESLDMHATVECFNDFNSPRVAQLTQRSNQFNLRSVRYDLADIKNMADSAEYATFAFSLGDKFGDNGITSVVILRKTDASTLFIDTWLMSCRVLKRGLEHFVANTIAAYAAANGFGFIEAEYLPTAKNKMVENHYSSLGFEPAGAANRFKLSVNDFIPFKTHITHK